MLQPRLARVTGVMSFGVYRPQMGVASGMRVLCSDQTLQEMSEGFWIWTSKWT